MQNALTNKSNHEILAQIIGPQAAASLAGKYQTLTAIIKADDADLTVLPGVGPGRAAQIKAALELAQRLSREVLGDSPILDTPEKIADFLRETVRPCTTETFHVILLNARRRLIRDCLVANGTLDQVVVHSRDVFRAAIAANASAIVLCHNHPSSDPTPSTADISVTRDLVRAGQLLKIEVIDHVILGGRTTERPQDYVSLREMGYFAW